MSRVDTSAREECEQAGAIDVEAAVRAPRVVGKTLTALMRCGAGWLVWDTSGGRSTVYAVRDLDDEQAADPNVVPLVTVDDVAEQLTAAGGHPPTAAELLNGQWAGVYGRGHWTREPLALAS